MGHCRLVRPAARWFKPAAACLGENERWLGAGRFWVYAIPLAETSLGDEMNDFQQDLQSSPLFARARGILLDPSAEWAKVAVETDQPKDVFLRYVLPLAAISPVASFIGGQVFGLGGFGITINIGLMAGLGIAIASFILSLVSVWVVAFVASKLASGFGGREDFPAAFRLIAYSWTAAWVVGIFRLVPMLGFLGILGLYSIYLLYKGATPVVGVPQDKAVGYTAVTILVAIVAMFVVNLAVGLFTAPLMMGAMSGAENVSIDMGANGTIESGEGGTMTITGPDGEEVTITVNEGAKE
jgi:hypothetical protein